ncbi:hypothetical protein ACFL03_06550 [Thermodesulfobacteriota bacterium]
MTLEDACDIYNQMKSTKHDSLFDELARSAIRYSRIRVDYMMVSSLERREMDEARTRAHTVFIEACNILSRNMYKVGEDNSWRSRLGDDRKTIGDFACYIHCLLGILAR